MSKSRKQWGEDDSRERSRPPKPPLGGNWQWQPSVPSWEKQFCFEVGCIPWKMFLDKKRCTYLYKNVLNWDDAAGKEAFQSSKSRFWANLNGLPCDLPLPDPNLYIDEVDWDSKIDPELLENLKPDSVAPVEGEKPEQVVILDELLAAELKQYTIGWGDSEENFKKPDGPAGDNPWSTSQANEAAKGGGWGDDWNKNDSWGCDQWKDNTNCRHDHWTDHPKTASFGERPWHGNTKNYKNTGKKVSGQANRRFYGDKHGANHEWSGGRGRWRNYSFRPVSHQRPTGLEVNHA